MSLAIDKSQLGGLTNRYSREPISEIVSLKLLIKREMLKLFGYSVLLVAGKRCLYQAIFNPEICRSYGIM